MRPAWVSMRFSLCIPLPQSLSGVSEGANPSPMSTHIDLGLTSGAQSPALVDLEELLATRLLVQGNSGSGKSHLLRRLLEQSAGLVQQVVIDPEGDFVTLAERFGHVVVDAAQSNDGELFSIATRARQHRVSIVLNLEGVDVDAQLKCAAVFLNGLFEVERDYWFPMLVVVDEAQLFAPAASADASDEARRQSLAAMTNLMCRGRKRGLAGIIATQRLAKLAKNVAAEASNFLMGRTFLDIDMARAADLLGMEKRQAEMFRDLPRGAFVGLGPAIARRPLTISIGDVETKDRGSAPKLLPLPGAKAKAAPHDLIFSAETPPPPKKTKSKADALATPEVVMARIEAAPQPAYVAAPAPDLTNAQREQAMEEIICAMAEDAQVAFRPMMDLHRDFLSRCRIKRLGATLPDLRAFQKMLHVKRAEMSAPEKVDKKLWTKAIALSDRLPDDMRAPFLLIARAAVAERPAPEDADIAQFFGSHSPSRARRLLATMEDNHLLVLRKDFQGARIIAIPELEIETKAVHPKLRKAGKGVA